MPRIHSEAAILSWTIPSIREARLKGMNRPDNLSRCSEAMRELRAKMGWKSPPGAGRKKTLEGKWRLVAGSWIRV